MNQTQISQKLVSFRDRLRVQAHLFSMDAQDVWQSLEREMTLLEEQLVKSGDTVIAAATDKVSELVERVETFVDQQMIGQLTLTSPARLAMSAGVLTCSANDSVNVAAQIMWDEDCGAVAVVDSMGRALGMLTDRDIAMACYTQGKSPEQVVVSSAMSKGIYTVRPDDSLAEVIASMKAHRIRRVPVMTDDGRIVGLISVSDVLRRLSGQRQVSPLEAALVDALIAISAKNRPSRMIRPAVAAE